MQEVAKLIRRHEDNILTYFDMPISNGIAEGLNNKAKVISHLAYGFRTAMKLYTQSVSMHGKSDQAMYIAQVSVRTKQRG